MDTNTTETQSTPSPATKPRRPKVAMNGVDTPALLATVGAVAAQPELAKFRFRATSRWLGGTHSQSVAGPFSGAGAEHQHKADYRYDADHPAVLVGTDEGPAPVEFLLHALAACLTAGVANVAAARGIRLDEVESTVEGDIDILGLLGLSDEVRNGYQAIRARFRIRGDASAEELRGILDRSRDRSAVFDVLTSGVPVSIEME